MKVLRQWTPALALLLLASACGLDGPSAARSRALVSVRVLTPATVRTVRVEVSGPGIDPPVVLSLAIAADSTAAGEIEVPAGSGRRIVITAFDTSGVATHRADTTLTLQGGSSQTLALRLLPIQTGLGIVVTFANAIVSLGNNGPIQLAVGDSAVITATATSAAGNPAIAGAIAWGSSAPASVSVEGGLVRGLRPGNAQITASYQGASASLEVQVFAPVPGDAIGGFLSFDGDADFVTIPGALFGGGETTSFTVEAWIRSDSTSRAPGYFFSKSASWQELNFGVGSSRLSAFYAYPTSYFSGASDTLLAEGIPWTHVAWTKSGATERLFLSGVLVHEWTGNAVVSWATDPGSFFLAAALVSSNRIDFRGDIAALRVSRAARYAASFIPGALVLDEDTELLYDFEDQTSATLLDLGHLQLHGTVVGATWRR